MQHLGVHSRHHSSASGSLPSDVLKLSAVTRKDHRTASGIESCKSMSDGTLSTCGVGCCRLAAHHLVSVSWTFRYPEACSVIKILQLSAPLVSLLKSARQIISDCGARACVKNAYSSGHRGKSYQAFTTPDDLDSEHDQNLGTARTRVWLQMMSLHKALLPLS